MSEVIVVIGAGSIGQAIARRVSAGKHVLLADLHRENADVAAEVMRDAGFDVSTATVDVSSRESVHALVETATTFGDVTGGRPDQHDQPRHHLHAACHGRADRLSR
jgi:NAD(P)-dependent dehydrogenase (short-subunit alcohol dehydrogenase family)